MAFPGGKQEQFGEWLKIRRLAAELTPVDVSKAIGVDMTTYRDIETDKVGLTRAMMHALTRVDRLKITMRDIQLRNPKVIATANFTDEAQAEAEQAAAAKSATTHIDTIIDSFQARQARQAPTIRNVKTVSPLGMYLQEKASTLQLTPLELARKCRMSPMDIEDISNGMVPGPIVLKGIAAGLGIDLAELQSLIGAQV